MLTYTRLFMIAVYNRIAAGNVYYLTRTAGEREWQEKKS